MVTIGETEYYTALMPKDGRYLVGLKAAVRRASRSSSVTSSRRRWRSSRPGEAVLVHPVRRASSCSAAASSSGSGWRSSSSRISDRTASTRQRLPPATGLSFFLSNVVISAAFLLLAATRRVFPGIGTLVQITVVGGVASLVLGAFEIPDSLGARLLLLAAALPVIAVGITLYLGARLGAGPIEAAGLAFDPPIPFRWSYNTVQAVAAVTGWLLGATLGVATLVVIIALGPLVDRTARLLRMNIQQRDPRERAIQR